nr:MAG TPA: hypothetical protein [Caudoviricetes sp.]
MKSIISGEKAKEYKELYYRAAFKSLSELPFYINAEELSFEAQCERMMTEENGFCFKVLDYEGLGTCFGWLVDFGKAGSGDLYLRVISPRESYIMRYISL